MAGASSCLVCGRSTVDAGPYLETDPVRVDWQGAALGEEHKLPVYLCLAEVLALGGQLSPVHIARKTDHEARIARHQATIAERDDLRARVEELEAHVRVLGARAIELDPAMMADAVVRRVEGVVAKAMTSVAGVSQPSRVTTSTSTKSQRGGGGGKPARS